MCTMIVEKSEISGSGKGPQGWFTVQEVAVSYDHALHLPLENALNIDFLNEAIGPSARAAVELTPESARELAHLILAALARGEAMGVDPAVAIP